MNFSIAIMIQKAVQSGVKAILGVLFGVVSAETLKSYGLEINVEVLTVALSALAVAGLEALRNYLKQKFKLSWL